MANDPPRCRCGIHEEATMPNEPQQNIHGAEADTFV
jgi:hypothetical protein